MQLDAFNTENCITVNHFECLLILILCFSQEWLSNTQSHVHLSPVKFLLSNKALYCAALLEVALGTATLSFLKQV